MQIKSCSKAVYKVVMKMIQSPAGITSDAKAMIKPLHLEWLLLFCALSGLHETMHRNNKICRVAALSLLLYPRFRAGKTQLSVAAASIPPVQLLPSRRSERRAKRSQSQVRGAEISAPFSVSIGQPMSGFQAQIQPNSAGYDFLQKLSELPKSPVEVKIRPI